MGAGILRAVTDDTARLVAETCLELVRRGYANPVIKEMIEGDAHFFRASPSALHGAVQAIAEIVRDDADATELTAALRARSIIESLTVTT